MVVRSFALSCQDIQREFSAHVSEIIGDPSRLLSRVSSPAQADAASIVFCATKDAIREGLESAAGALVLPPSAMPETTVFRGTVLVCAKPEALLPEFLQRHVLATPYRSDYASSGVHPTARVDATAEIAADATVGPGAFVGRGARIGARAHVGANAVVEADVRIGEDSVVHPLAYVGHSTLVGARCEIHPGAVVGKEGFGYHTDERGRHRKIPHVGRVVLEDDVHVGANCSIDRGTLHETRIGAGAKLDNQVHVAHNCSIGAGSILTAQFAMAGSSHVGRFFVAGGRSSVTGHVRVGDGVRIAGLSAVSKNVAEPGDYGGVPLVPLQQHVKIKAAMVQLPEMRKQVARLMKRVFGDEGDRN